MKYRIHIYTGLLIVLSVFFSCNRLQYSNNDCSTVRLNAVYNGGDCQTKSSIIASDTKISSLDVFVYSKGHFFEKAYVSESSVSFDLPSGGVYTIYAIANLPEITPVELETDFVEKRLSAGTVSQINSKGFPMSGALSSLTVNSVKTDFIIELHRLTARYDLQVVKSMKKYGFSVTSVKLEQAASDITPFKVNSTPLGVESGDKSLSSDVAKLNAGTFVSYYMLENCQGVLLPYNNDPWKKIPDMITSKKNVCTYLQLDGTWTAPGLKAPITYKMFLGQDNCTDFNIRRNTVNTLTLNLTDEGVFASSWKVTRGPISDSRTLKFDRSVLTVLPDGNYYSSNVSVSPAGVEYSVEGDDSQLSSLGITMRLQNDVFSARTFDIPSADSYTTVKLKTWDGVYKGNMQLYVPTVGLTVSKGIRLVKGQSCTASVSVVPSKSVSGWPMSYSVLDPSVARVEALSSNEYKMNVTALKVGHSSVRSKYGPVYKDTDLIVSDVLKNFTYNGFVASLTSGDVVTFKVGPNPDHTFLGNLVLLSNTNPEVLSLNSEQQISVFDPMYADYAPDYGTFKAGAQFTFEAVNPGLAELTFRSNNPVMVEKKYVEVQIGYSDGMIIRCESEATGAVVEKSIAGTKSIQLESSDVADITWIPVKKGGLVTDVYVEDMTPLKGHPGWEAQDYYQLEQMSGKYQNECWKLQGTDCSVTLGITAGSNAETFSVTFVFGG